MQAPALLFGNPSFNELKINSSIDETFPPPCNLRMATSVLSRGLMLWSQCWFLLQEGVRAQHEGRLQPGGEASEAAVTTENSLARETAPSLASNPSVRVLPVR